MSKSFLYAEVQTSVPFEKAPWQKLNPEMKKEPGLLRKTWLSGLETNTVGGIYEFESLQTARAYVDHYVSGEARSVGGAGSLTTRFYDADVTEQASLEMNSPWLKPKFGPSTKGRTYLFNEMNWSIPFEEVPWRELNAQLKNQPGLLSKPWFSGINTRSVAGFYEFDSKSNALAFAFGMFAEECRKLGVTANTKLFDADIVEAASRDMKSPYYQ
jgi:Putative mono-oxygenase ydhR